MNGETGAALQGSQTFTGEEVLNLRVRGRLPQGKCIYIQSGDPGDFDGYLIAVAGAELQRRTKDFQFALVVPERRACSDREEADVNRHEDEFSEQVMHVVGRLTRHLCPHAVLIRGPLNARNVIPLKFVFSEPEKYGPLLAKRNIGSGIYWRSVLDLAALVSSDVCESVMIDMNGSIGYLPILHKACPSLGSKVKASGMPVCVMAGVLAEMESLTLRVPGRDPRATMNALYDAASVQLLLTLATEHEWPLLFITNNVCNTLLCFNDGTLLSEELQLQGLLQAMAIQWYGPHLAGKCVPFDWVSFCAMVFQCRWPELLTTETRHLYVGCEDPSVLVLYNPASPKTDVVERQLEGTQYWGEVESVTCVDREAMIDLARAVAAEHKDV